jgi:hypothetical protein
VSVAAHLLVAMFVWTSSPGVASDGGAVRATLSPPGPGIELVGLSATQREVVTHAVDLFGEAGLPLPEMVVRGTPDPTACDGHDGLHQPREQWSEVFLCSSTADEWFRRVVVHELAHAWSTIGLPVERRDAFQMLRGWEHWSNHDVADWRDNGTEQAAEIIAWGISDQAAPTVQIDHDSCAELRTGYVTLTGTEPLHGLTSLCGPTSQPMARS